LPRGDLIVRRNIDRSENPQHGILL